MIAQCTCFSSPNHLQHATSYIVKSILASDHSLGQDSKHQPAHTGAHWTDQLHNELDFSLPVSGDRPLCGAVVEQCICLSWLK